MKKGVETWTLFIIAVTVIFLFFALAFFMGWIKLTNNVTNPLLCNDKLLNYCAQWSSKNYQDTPYSWSDQAPGCAKQGIVPDVTSCKNLLHQN